MSILSLYLSGADEEELFRLTDPNEHPDNLDESAARQEEESLASGNYDVLQDELDELTHETSIATDLQGLSEEELGEVARLIEGIRQRNGEDDPNSAV
jgi:hypothetical protein